MFYTKLTATYGKLNNDSLSLCPGLNIITAPNESGKSTWGSFISSMFYGISTKERDRQNSLSDKKHYAPWNGLPMQGELQLNKDGKEITIRRFSKTNPFDSFSATYSGSGIPISDCTKENAADLFLGISKDVYLRTSFLRQSDATLSENTELEHRILSLLASGDDTLNPKQVSKELHAAVSSIIKEKNGLLSNEAQSLNNLMLSSQERSSLSDEIAAYSQKLHEYSILFSQLEDELQSWNSYENVLRYQKMQSAIAQQDVATEKLRFAEKQIETNNIPSQETLYRLKNTVSTISSFQTNLKKQQDISESLAHSIQAVQAELETSPIHHCQEDAQKLLKSKPLPWIVSLLPIILGIPIIYIVYSLLGTSQNLLSFCIPTAILVFLSLFIGILPRLKAKNLLRSFHAADLSSLERIFSAYTELLQKQQALQQEQEKSIAIADSIQRTLRNTELSLWNEIHLFAPGIQELQEIPDLLNHCSWRHQEIEKLRMTAENAAYQVDLLIQQGYPIQSPPPMDPPIHSRDEIELKKQNLQRSQIETEFLLSKAQEKLQSFPSQTELDSQIKLCQSSILALQKHALAIQMAEDTIQSASDTLQLRFSPELGKRAAEFFSFLTNNSYQSVILDRSFHSEVTPFGDFLPRDALFLSAGTLDQLYLSIRLAICEMILPSDKSIPLILDDALTNFDDERCFQALRLLKEISSNRQILLFTCHKREANFFMNDPEVHVLELTQK